MKKILLTSLVFLIFQGTYLPVFGMKAEDTEFSVFVQSAKSTNAKILELLQKIQIVSDCTEGRVLVHKALNQEQEKLRENQNHENLKTLLKKIETLKATSDPFLSVTSEEYLRNSQEKQKQMTSLNASRLQMLGEFSELQTSLSFSFFEDRQRLMQGIQEAVAGERDALRMVVETQKELVELKEKILGSPRPSAAAAASASASDDVDGVLDLAAASAPRARTNESFALVLTGGSGAQPLQLDDSRSFNIVGARFVQPEEPFVAEMFLGFHDDEIKRYLRDYESSRGSNFPYSQGFSTNGRPFIDTLIIELALNQRFLRILNGIENGLSVDPKGVFTIEKGEKEIELTRHLFKFYQTFFAQRTFFLRDFHDYFRRSHPKRKIVLLEGKKTLEENKQIKDMVKIFQNLYVLLTDIRDHYLVLDIPLDVKLSVEDAKKKVTAAFQSVKPTQATSNSYSFSLPKEWSAINVDSYFESFRDATLNDHVMGRNLKGYVSMRDYLRELERKLLALTFVERTTFSDFFE